MMKIKKIHWLIFILWALTSSIIWYRFTYPQLTQIDLNINREKALDIAHNYLLQKGIDSSQYKKAILFTSDVNADRYLQRSIGFQKEKEFIAEHEFDMFFWIVRFFKEKQKEEVKLSISSKDGEVSGFNHIIEDTEERESPSLDKAKSKAIEFLQNHYQLDIAKNYTFHSEKVTKYENRTDYSFSWEKNELYIPWSDNKEDGGAKILTSATVSGEEIRFFSKNSLDIPEKFNRYVAEQKNIGNNLSAILRIVKLILLIGAIFFVIKRRHHIAMHTTKNFFIGLATFLFFILILSELNQFEFILFNYPTTSPLKDHIARIALNTLVGLFIFSIGFIMPSLAGESLRYENFQQKKESGFLHYIQSTFFSRGVFKGICLGYFTFLIMLGIQSFMFKMGQDYLGVWVEYSWVTKLSSTYIPLFVAFAIALEASVLEEITYRVFAINWFKKIFKNTLFAVLLASIIWGFCHSGYPIFPMWFRGVEVTALGLFLSFIYLRFGIIPVLIGHYVFDVFWNSSGYLLGKTLSMEFFSSLFVLLLPLLFGIIAFFANRPEEEKPLKWWLNKHQLYNLNILNTFLRLQFDNNKKQSDLKNDLIGHGWDIGVVEAALEETESNAPKEQKAKRIQDMI